MVAVASALLAACGGGGGGSADAGAGAGSLASGGSGSGGAGGSGSGASNAGGTNTGGSNAGGSNTGSSGSGGSGIGGGGGTVTGPQPGGGTTTPPPTTEPPPPPPWEITITPVSRRGLRLDWPAVPGATRYEIARDVDSTDGANAFTTVQTLNGSGTNTYTYTFQDLRLVDAMRHTYRVRACTNSDCSVKEASASVNSDLAGAADALSGPDKSFGRVMATASRTVRVNGSDVLMHWVAIGAPEVGRVRVFQRPASGGSWVPLPSVLADAKAGEEFGASLAFSSNGEWLAVGVPGESLDGAGIEPQSTRPLGNSGAVIVYRCSPLNGVHDCRRYLKLKAFNPGAGDRFGSAVGFNASNILAVGAPGEDSLAIGPHPASTTDASVFEDAPTGTSENSGAVYLYVLNIATPTATLMHTYLKPYFELASQAPQASEAHFGSTLAWGRDDLAVGAPRASLPTSNAGAVQMFRFNGSGLLYLDTLKSDVASDVPSDEGFGAALALNEDGSLLLVGYPSQKQPTGLTGAKQGAVYPYARNNNQWLLASGPKGFASPTPGDFERFGMSLSVSGTGPTAKLLVGAWGDSANHAGLQLAGAFSPAKAGGPRDAGAAFYYELVNNEWVVKARLKAPQPDIDQHMGRSVLLTTDGQEMLMGADTSTAVIGY